MYNKLYNATQPVNEFGLVVTTFSPTSTDVIMSCISPMITSTEIIIVNTTSERIGRKYLLVVAQLLV